MVTQLAKGTKVLKNFTRDDDRVGMLVRGGLVGAGRGAGGSLIRLAQRSSTRKKAVPTKKGATTNPLYLLKVLGSIDVEVGAFALEGSEQGHLFNGLRVDHADGVRLHDVRIDGIPGNSDINPGETFLANLYRCTNVFVHDVELDGAGIGASGLGLNTCSGSLRVDSVTGHDLRWCKVIAGWKQPKGGTLSNVQALHSAFGFGLEQSSGHYLIPNYKSRGVTGADLHLGNSGGQYGHATVEFRDPDLQPGQQLKVLIPPTELGKPNKQVPSHVTCTVGGKDRPDLLKFVRKA